MLVPLQLLLPTPISPTSLRVSAPSLPSLPLAHVSHGALCLPSACASSLSLLKFFHDAGDGLVASGNYGDDAVYVDEEVAET